MIRVKICGVRDQAAIAACARAGADWVGFVFFARSPRHVAAGEAAVLASALPGGIGRVGLFVEPSDTEIASVLAACPLDVLQLYAPVPRAAEISARFGLPVWRSIGVSAEADLPQDAQAAAGFVIEPRPPEGASRPGGNAVALDWAMLAGWRPNFAWLLAGGLTPANVAHAIAASGAPAVDVSSGVETAPGEKSPALIEAFIAAARSGQRPPAP